MNAGAQLQPRDETPLEAAMSRISERVSAINSAVESLEVVLQKALRPSVPTPSNDKAIKEVQTARSELVERCDQSTLGLNIAIDRIQALMSRLEV